MPPAFSRCVRGAVIAGQYHRAVVFRARRRAGAVPDRLVPAASGAAGTRCEVLLRAVSDGRVSVYVMSTLVERFFLESGSFLGAASTVTRSGRRISGTRLVLAVRLCCYISCTEE